MEIVQPIRDPQKIKDIAAYLKKKNERDFVLFATGIYTGLRITDVLNLQVRDVRGHKYLNVIEGKTGKHKRIKIADKLLKIYADYVEGKEEYEYLFPSKKGINKPITRSRAYDILKGAARQFGVYSIGCHSMRKTFGYMLYQNTKDVALVQELLNHSSPTVTLRYIGINQDHKDKAISELDFL